MGSKHAHVSKTNIDNGKSAMLVGCGYKDELKYRQHKRARSQHEATILGTMATLVAGFTPLNYHKNSKPVC